jgi:hypothetical protein
MHARIWKLRQERLSATGDSAADSRRSMLQRRRTLQMREPQSIMRITP